MLVLISAERAALSARENEQRTAELADLLAGGFPGAVQPGTGCYQGRQETTFAVTVYGGKGIEQLKQLAILFEQDTILLVANPSAVIVNPRTMQIELSGKWREVSEADAHASAGWTRLGNKFFVLA